MEEKKVIVEAFDQPQVQDLEIMREQNNLFGSLRIQEEQSKKQIQNLKKILDDLNTDKVKVHDLIVPYGMGGFRRLLPQAKQDLIKAYVKQLEIEENKLNAIIGQRQHRADEVGEQRLKVFRMLWSTLVTQHGFKNEELCEHCTEYMKNNTNRAFLRPEQDITDIIKKAGETIV